MIINSSDKKIVQGNCVAGWGRFEVRGKQRLLGNKKNQSAFTLIEVMVSVSIFLIVMVIALGAVLAIVDGNKKTQAITSVSNNLNATVESMVRDIKTGYSYKCGEPPHWPIDGKETNMPCVASDLNTKISFISTISGDKRAVEYSLVTTANGTKGIQKRFCPANIAADQCANNAANFKTLFVTSPDIDIKALEFYVKVPPPNEDQPGVFILIKGTAFLNKTTASDFSMQTFVSQRTLNL